MKEITNSCVRVCVILQLGPEAVYEKGKKITRGYPDIRWHQTADQGSVPNTRMPNTFMATAVDLTDDKSPYGR